MGKNGTSSLKKKIEDRFQYSMYEALILAGCIITSAVMIVRMFYGTEMTDEAYYISDAIQMMHGNLPYVYNNYSYGTGAAFLIIPFVFIYGLIVPNNEGVFLYTRICFMLFWLACTWLGYRVLKKDFGRKNALLISGMMIPSCAGVAMYNFSYNSIPSALAYVCGLSIYDAIEHKNKWTRLKLVAAGFAMGIAFFAHPGYGIAIAVFGILVLIKSEGEKVVNFICCIVGGLLEVAVIFVSIIVQVGTYKLYVGIYNMFHAYPTGTASDVNTASKILTTAEYFLLEGFVLVVVIAIVYIFANRYNRKENKKFEKKECFEFSFAVAIFVLILRASFLGIVKLNGSLPWMLGMIGVLAAVIALFFGLWKNYSVYWYLGIYPIVFSIAQIVAVNSNASVSRFCAAIPALVVVLLLMLESKSKLVRGMTTCCIGLCTLAMIIGDYAYVYRDESISNLNVRVESGVYKGIYTTEARAHDLPELEEYLNSIVGEEEQYAFRDNVPAAYLMMHKGVMVDKDTWDCLNYSYHINAPDNLYDYYKRRGDFPRKYIYVDYGRDENLSIDDADYKLNEFIHTYYEKTEDFTLNETFYHVVVYEYKGGFDGDFDYWIEKHMWSPKENSSDEGKQ